MIISRRLLVLVLALWAGPAYAQNQISQPGRLRAANDCVVMPAQGMGTGSVQLVGTWAGTVSFTVSNTGDSGDYVAVNVTAPNSSSSVTSSTANGLWSGSIASYRYFRACMTSFSSGEASVLLSAAGTGGGGGGGGGAAGSVTINDPTTSSQKAAVNASGQMAVNCANCSGTGVSQQDNTAFTGGTSNTTPAGALYNTSPPAITSGNVGAPRMDASRYLYAVFPSAQLVTQSGTWTIQPGNTANTTAWLVTGAGGTFPATQSGTWNITNISGTVSLPTGAATAAKQPSLGTAGASSADVISVQGIASGTALPASQSGTWTIQPGNTANTTAWLVAGGKTNNNAAPGATNIGALTALANAAAPSYTEGNLVALSTDLTGALRVSGGGGGTQYTQNTALTVASSVGNMAMGRASAAAPTDVGADNNAVMPWYLRSGSQVVQPSFAGILATTGNGVSGTGVQRVTIASDSGITNAQASTTSGEQGILGLGAVSTNAPSYTTAQSNALSMQVDGSLRVAVTNGATGGTSQVDNATFTDNTSNLTPIGGPAEIASPTSCAEGKFCSAATTLNRSLKVTLYDTSGTALTPSQDITHNVAVATAGPQVMLSGSSSIPTAVTTGNAVRAWAGLNGQLATMLVDASGNTVSVGGGTQYTQDTALTVASTVGTMAVGRASAAAPTDVGADNRTVMPWYLRSGAQAVQSTFGGVLALGAANALNSTGGGIQAVQTVAQFDDVSPTAITENQFGNVRMSANRNQYSTLRDAAGNERGANINAGNELLVNPYSSTPAASAYQTFRITDGASYITPSTDYVQDAALTVSSTTGGMTMGRAHAAAATDVSNDDDAVMAWFLRSGATVTNPSFGGVLSVAGNGVSGTGVQRVTLASDSTGQVAIAGTATVAGGKTNNNAAPGATNIGALAGLANAAAPTFTEGNLVALSTDLAGNLRVTGGGGGTQYTQNVALTVASTIGTMAMGRASAAAPTDVGADNNAVMPWYLRSGAQATQSTFAGVLATTGNGVSGTGVQRVTLASDSTGQVALAAGAATIGALTANQTVNVAQINGVTTTMGNGASGTGVQRVTIASDSTGQIALAAGAATIGALTANQSVNTAQINGVTPLMGNGASGTGAMRVTVASDSTGQIALATGANTIGALTANQSVNHAQVNGVTVSTGVGASGTGVQRVVDVASGTTGAAPPTQAGYIGGLQSGATGGFLGGITACDLGKTVNISTATTTLLVTGVSGRQVRICSYHLFTQAANNVALIEGTGATCGTGSAGLAGGTTAASGYNFGATQGIATGSGLGEVMTTATTGDSVCVVTSAATQLSGYLKYTIY